MNQEEFLSACVREVEEAHAFFQAWFGGKLERNEVEFGRFANALAPDFTIIDPGGSTTDYATLLKILHDSHDSTEVVIEVKNVMVRPISANLALSLYEEWQHNNNGRTTVRQSSALFEQAAHTPNGVQWRHVHETWMS